jgi:hypothetical protein
LKIDPADFLSHVCSHFNRLFELRSTEGMLPKMNELYLFVNEQTNFLKVLRSMLGVEKDASVHSLLSTLRQALDQADGKRAVSTSDGAAPYDDASSGAAAPAVESAPAGEGASAKNANSAEVNNGADAPPASSKLPQYIALAAELRKLMHAPSVLAIVPAAKEMQRSLMQYKQSNLQMQELIQQLCATLSIGSAEARLAERIQALAVDPDSASPGASA